jgi:hypothetical protein
VHFARGGIGAYVINLDPTMNLPTLLVITVFAVPIGAVEFGEWLHWRAAKILPVEQGNVIGREEYRRWGGIPAGRLHIRIAKDNSVVQANLARSAMLEAPNALWVHYGGNANDEVVLATEPSPIWLVLFFWGGPTVLWNLYAVLRKNPKFKQLVT